MLDTCQPPSTYVIYVCHLCMSSTHVIYVCHVCVSSTYVIYVCHLGMFCNFVEANRRQTPPHLLTKRRMNSIPNVRLYFTLHGDYTWAVGLVSRLPRSYSLSASATALLCVSFGL